jgi:hypothetical protein
MDYPEYSYPRGFRARIARDVLLGVENIPQHGPCVVTVNHYHRDGFGAQWLALAIAACVSTDMHWVMTGEFTYTGKWYERIGAFGSKLLLSRIAAIYSFTTMPPMPPRAEDVEARAASVRAVLEYVRHADNPILGLAPEGRDPEGPGGVLAHPASGLGRFGLLLSNAGLKFIPVGAYEVDGVFTIHFGEGYELSVPRGLSADEKDAQAAQLIMKNIAHLLPMNLRGEFV